MMLPLRHVLLQADLVGDIWLRDSYSVQRERRVLLCAALAGSQHLAGGCEVRGVEAAGMRSGCNRR